MKNAIIILLLLVTAGKNIHAQQQAEFSLYNQFSGIYNPSAIPDEYRDHEHNLVFGVNGRTQWTNLHSGPETQSLRGEFITDNQSTFNLLMGGYFLHDKAGPISTMGAYVRLATIMSDYDPVLGGISAGFQLGGVQYAINTTELHAKYPQDVATASDIRFVEPQLSVGVSYYNSFRYGIFRDTKINTGISIAHLGLGGDDAGVAFKRAIHYYAYGKIKKRFSTGRSLELNSWVRFVKNTPVNVDVHLLYEISTIFSFEAGINTAGIAHIGFGLDFLDFFNGSNSNLLHLNYSYNPSFFLRAAGAFGNTHEVNLSYSLAR